MVVKTNIFKHPSWFQLPTYPLIFTSTTKRSVARIGILEHEVFLIFNFLTITFCEPHLPLVTIKYGGACESNYQT